MFDSSCWAVLEEAQFSLTGTSTEQHVLKKEDSDVRSVCALSFLRSTVSYIQTSLGNMHAGVGY